MEENFHLLRDLLIPNLAREFRKFTAFFRHPDEFQKAWGKKVQVDQNYLVTEFSMNLQIFIDICKARKLTPVLMTQANRLKENPDQFIVAMMKLLERDHGLAYQEYKKIYEKFNETAVE